MKKTIALGLVLFLLAGLSLGMGSWAVNREREAVTITEEVLVGDSAAGAGITISTISTAGDHLTWRTDYTLGGDCRTTFSSEEGVWRQLREYTQQNFYVSMNLSYGFSGPVDSSYGAYGNDKVVRPIVEDLLKDMSPGDVKTEKVRLADYTDVYPFRLEGEVMGVYVEGDDAIQRVFPIPMAEDYILHVSIALDDTGRYIDVDLEPEYLDANIWSLVLAVEDCGYWVPFHTAPDGSEVDLSLYPDGYGIYRLPMLPARTEDTEDGRYYRVAAEGEPFDTMVLDVDNVACVFPLDPEKVETSRLWESRDGTAILLYTVEEGEQYLTVISLADYRQLQRIDLGPLGEEESQWLWSLEQADGYLLVWYNDVRFQLLEGTAATGYELVMEEYLYQVSDTDSWYFGRWATAYDGERFAAAWYPIVSEGYIEMGNSARLVVYTREKGLAYVGEYHHSGDYDRAGKYQPAYGERAPLLSMPGGK